MTSRREPPRLARWLAGRICPKGDRRFVLDDLAEGFEEIADRTGPGAARRWYRAQVLRSIGPCLRLRWRSVRRRGGGRELRVHRRAPPDVLRDLVAEFSFSVRSLRRDPLVVVVTVVSIGLGIAIVTTVFAAYESILLRPPGAVRAPDQIVAVHTSEPAGNPYGETSYLDYVDVIREVPAFAVTAVWRAGGVTLADEEGERSLLVEVVDGSYFDLLGVELPLGRPFGPEEARVGAAEPVVVLSHALWADRYGEDPSVLGRTVRLDGRDFTVLGIAPEALRGRMLELNVDAWLPIGIPGGTSRSTEAELANRGDRDYSVLARLAPGVGPDQAEAQLERLATRLREEHPDVWTNDVGEWGFTLLTGVDARIPPDGRTALTGVAFLMAAVGGLILLIACSNVAGLFLARGERRSREIAVRVSMGASQARILRLLFVESLLLGLVASGAGMALTRWAVAILGKARLPFDVPVSFHVEADPRAFTVAMAIGVGTSLLFGLLPALRASHPDLAGVLKGTRGAMGGRARRFGLRQFLVGAQVSGSLVLLVAAALVLRSLDRAAGLELGIEPERVAITSATVSNPQGGEAAHQLLRGLMDDIGARPEIEGVAASLFPDASLFFGGGLEARLDIPGWSAPDDRAPEVSFNSVTAGYFDLLEMPIVIGRGIDERDVQGTTRAAVVNEEFARRYWADEPPLGRTFDIVTSAVFDSRVEGHEGRYEVVGVTPGVSLDPTRPPRPAFWTALAQVDRVEEVVLHAQSRSGAGAAVRVLREELRSHDIVSNLFSPQPYRTLIDAAFAGSRAASRLLGWAGLFTLLLASAGVFGIVSYSVARRAPEMAVRRALGARGRQVVRVLVRDAMTVVVGGAALGLGIVGALAPLARDLLYGLAPLDPLALSGATMVLVSAALVASWLPARRMARVDPVGALKDE